MIRSARAKIVLYIAVLLSICSVVFFTGRFICLVGRSTDLQTAGHSNTAANLQNYLTFAPTKEQLLSEMRSLGVLTNNSSEWYVSPSAARTGKGTKDVPWDLATALAGGAKGDEIKPGDVVWLRSGRYVGSFTSTVKGTANAPIHFRQFPGERAVIDKADARRETAALAVRGPYVWFWDFEVTNSFPERHPLDPDGGLNPWRGSGINVWAPQTKYIDLVVHDNGHGFGLWNEDGGTEIYGCLIYNNGNNKKEHGVYGHNRSGTQSIADNLIFNNAGYGLHIYANSTKSSIAGFDIAGNVLSNNGALTGNDQVADQILVGGVDGVAAERITIKENYVYNTPDAITAKNRGVRLGYEDKNNVDVKLLDNFIVSLVPLKVLGWRTVESRRNTIVTDGKAVEIETSKSADLHNYVFDSDNYLQSKKRQVTFLIDGNSLDFSQWQAADKFDVSGRAAFLGDPEKQPRVFVRPNRYDPRRAQIAVFNLGNLASVQVYLSGFLQKGDTFEIRDAQNYMGKPVYNGTYDGREIIIPMEGKETAKPLGNTERTPVHTDRGFGFFVILKGPGK